MNKYDFIIFSDGGGEKNSSAASACIIENVKELKRVNLVAFLGPGTNNEGEILASLLGLSYIFNQTKGDESIKLVADSEYFLKSATAYIHTWIKNGWKTASKSKVKNLGLWMAYVELRKKYSIEPEHVRGHSGHPENEKCDSASTWVRFNAEKIFDESQSNAIEVEIGGEAWTLFDFRTFIDKFRLIDSDFNSLNFSEVMSESIEFIKNSKINQTKCITPTFNSNDQIEIDEFKNLLQDLFKVFKKSCEKDRSVIRKKVKKIIDS